MQLAKRMRHIGRLCFTVMWLPFAAGMIGMFSLPEGSYDFAELPALTRYSILTGAPLAVAAMVLLVGASVVSGVAHQKIVANGQRAQAKVLKLWETGTTINRAPVVRMLLEVQPPGQRAFQAEAERLVQLIELPQIQPGSVVHVKYDPATQAVALLSAEDVERMGQ